MHTSIKTSCNVGNSEWITYIEKPVSYEYTDP